MVHQTDMVTGALMCGCDLFLHVYGGGGLGGGAHWFIVSSDGLCARTLWCPLLRIQSCQDSLYTSA